MVGIFGLAGVVCSCCRMAWFCSNWRLKHFENRRPVGVWISPFSLPIGSMAQCKSFDVTIPVNAETKNYMKVGHLLKWISMCFWILLGID